MFGEPKDVDNQCNARLFIADNYGDGQATMRCQRPPGHDELHQEQFPREGSLVTVTWVADERKKCDHGCGQWQHDHRSEVVQCPRDADGHEFSDCAFCHAGEPARTCAVCGGTYYFERGHKLRCPRERTDCEDDAFVRQESPQEESQESPQEESQEEPQEEDAFVDEGVLLHQEPPREEGAIARQAPPPGEEPVMTDSVVNIVTDTATLAEALYPEGGLQSFNAGVYAGTKTPIRKLTGREVVVVAGTTAGAKVISDEPWIVDRFGEVGARQIKRLRELVKGPS